MTNEVQDAGRRSPNKKFPFSADSEQEIFPTTVTDATPTVRESTGRFSTRSTPLQPPSVQIVLSTSNRRARTE
jgi:hypothetical protein